MKAKEFEPFSEEWKNEMMKFTKIGLIECLLKPALIKNKELITKNEELIQVRDYFVSLCIENGLISNMKGDSKEYSYNQLVNWYNRAYKN